MSFKDNQDLRPKGEGGWNWMEHELYSVFLPLIGPLGCAVYAAMTRLVPLVPVDPYRYRVSLRQLAEWSGMSKSSVDKQLKILLKLGMVVETKYLDGRDSSYKLVSLRELAKVGEAELKKRIGVHHTDTAPFDQRAKHQAERARKAAKRKENTSSSDDLPFEAQADDENDGVHYTDTTTEQAEDAAVDEVGVHHVDTVSTSRVKSSTSEAMSSTAYGHPIENRTTEASITPLPPAGRGEVVPDDPDMASPSLPSPGCVYGDAGFPANVPVAALWVMAQLGITQRRLQEAIAMQLELWCKRNRGTTLEGAATAMATAGRKLHEDAHLLRHRPWGWRRFIAEGHWARPLPYDAPSMREVRQMRDAAVGAVAPQTQERRDAESDAWIIRIRVWMRRNADALEALPAVQSFAKPLRAMAESLAFPPDDEPLNELQERVTEAFLASLSDEERRQFDNDINALIAVERRRLPNVPQHVWDESAQRKRLRLLQEKYNLPSIGWVHQPLT